jgi:hypothetical protein
MNIDRHATLHRLKQFDFSGLFTQELGWDWMQASLPVYAGGIEYVLQPIAQKRGVQVYHCPPSGNGSMPDYATRRRIDKEATKSAYEHLIIFTDASQSIQIWQWVSKEPGKPKAYREYELSKQQCGEALLQRLEHIAFNLNEEEGLTLTGVTFRLKDAFDKEKITKRFYDCFKKELDAFKEFLQGIDQEEMENWYASVMMSRLMFIYFIQKKGLLNDDIHYLRNQLQRSRQRGVDRYYKDFLCPLFFAGFAAPEAERSSKINQLLGDIPYLDGGLFLRHQIEERYGEKICIADAVFERIFQFFDGWEWHLDVRPTCAGNEINPDVLGYIFEKYINQKQMGAYYTKEDITEYISKNTIIPRLFDEARKQCKIAFKESRSAATGSAGFQPAIWTLLSTDPDRYIYDAMRLGVIDENGEVIPESALPDFVQKGMHDPRERMHDARYNLHEADLRNEQGRKLTLPTETWREYVSRRNRCLEIRETLRSGQIHDIHDLITYNLNIRQFARDVIESCEGPELLRAFWHAIRSITVLDPTCGSGAFLFAALNILEDLYEASIDRMQAFVDELSRSGEKHRPEKYQDFRAILDQIHEHPNRKYFVFKSIILNNLYGVDIMDEAVEICKLRLFLKLVAQIEDKDQIEPLPDIDFNIRAGNTLVGFTSLQEVKNALSDSLLNDDIMQSIEEKAQDAERMFGLFRTMQTEQKMNSKSFHEAKNQLRKRLTALEEELNHYLAGEYGIQETKGKKYEQWLASHKPFHWCVDFYGIMKNGGFDVIFGNPPYVKFRKICSSYSIIDSLYKSVKVGNLYALCAERASILIKINSFWGMIVPSGIVGLDDAVSLRKLLIEKYSLLYFSTYSIRPSKLFEGVDQRLCIILGSSNLSKKFILYTTNYHHWNSEERVFLFKTIIYNSSFLHEALHRIPQIGRHEAYSCLCKIELKRKIEMGSFFSNSKNIFLSHYHRSPRYWIRAMDFEQYFKSPMRLRSIHHFRDIYFKKEIEGKCISAIINSSLFFFWFISVGNGRNITGLDVKRFPVGDISEKINLY